MNVDCKYYCCTEDIRWPSKCVCNIEKNVVLFVKLSVILLLSQTDFLFVWQTNWQSNVQKVLDQVDRMWIKVRRLTSKNNEIKYSWSSVKWPFILIKQPVIEVLSSFQKNTAFKLLLRSHLYWVFAVIGLSLWRFF